MRNQKYAKHKTKNLLCQFHLELGVYDVVANFYVGRKSSILISEITNLTSDKYTFLECYNITKKVCLLLTRMAYQMATHNSLLKKDRKNKEEGR